MCVIVEPRDSALRGNVSIAGRKVSVWGVGWSRIFYASHLLRFASSLPRTKAPHRVHFNLGAEGVRWAQGEKIMKSTRAQKKAKLQAAAERLIEQMLDWDEQNARPNLTAIEDEVLKLRQQFGQEMADVVVGGQETRQPVEAPPCPECGKAMRYKGQKRKAVANRLGGIEIERGYYYCAACESGSFPPGRAT